MVAQTVAPISDYSIVTCFPDTSCLNWEDLTLAYGPHCNKHVIRY